jgi:hypothetical protein
LELEGASLENLRVLKFPRSHAEGVDLGGDGFTRGSSRVAEHGSNGEWTVKVGMLPRASEEPMKYNFISDSDQPAPLPSPPLPMRDLLGIGVSRDGRGEIGARWKRL